VTVQGQQVHCTGVPLPDDCTRTTDMEGAGYSTVRRKLGDCTKTTGNCTRCDCARTTGDEDNMRLYITRKQE
jgi:hypothetical protein